MAEQDPESDGRQSHPTLAGNPTVQWKRVPLGKGLGPLLGSSPPITVPKRTVPTPQEVARTKRGLHERLRSARIAQGMDEADVATKVGVTPLKYKSYEEHIWPPHHLIPRLCEVLRICAGELYGTHR